MTKTAHKRALKDFGINLNKFRKKKKLSLRKLSYICKIDHSKIAKIERGEINITFYTILELAKALEIQPKKLLDIDFE